MQQAAFRQLGLAWQYLAWETPPDQVSARVAGLRGPAFVGANVTVPHKAAVIPLLDAVDPEAGFVGAVNTIVNDGGRLVGYNTDVPGFLRALREDLGFDPAGASVLVLGAGGAARAVAYGLLRAKCRALLLANRGGSRAAGLAAALSATGSTNMATVPWDAAALLAAAIDCDLVVNTTTVGMHGSPAAGESPLPAGALRPRQAVFDLVYNPSDTPLVRAAREAGARALSGLPMLVYQGAAAFTLWTGLAAPVEVMRAAATAALKGE
jgi:shikimate dehydrogenase